jgi:hypothetical protein
MDTEAATVPDPYFRKERLKIKTIPAGQLGSGLYLN